MKRLLKRMLDPAEFLSDYGIRAISRYHLEHPYRLELDGAVHEVRYEPAESSHRPVRRQLELARPDLVSDQFPALSRRSRSSTTTTATIFWSKRRRARARS